MSSTDGLTRWLAPIEQAAREAHISWAENGTYWWRASTFRNSGHDDVDARHIANMSPAVTLAVLAVVQAAEACMAREVWIGYSEGGIRYCNDCEACWPQSHKPGCSVQAMMNALAALRAQAEEAPWWADQEADVQPSRG